MKLSTYKRVKTYATVVYVYACVDISKRLNMYISIQKIVLKIILYELCCHRFGYICGYI